MSSRDGSDAPSAAGKSAGRLRIVLALTASYLVVEVVGGILTGSLALIADAGHMLTDVAGVSMALLAIWFASRPATAEKTYGYYRLEILAALANGFLLLGVAAYILYEAYHRILEPPDVLGLPMLSVAAVGLLVNLLSAYLLLHGQKTSLNMRGAFLEVVSDLLGSVAVIIAGLIILTTGFNLVDPIASAVIGLFIVPRTWVLMNEAVHILLEGAPKGVDLSNVRQHVLKTQGVVDVHDLHVWTITSGMNVISAHVVVEDRARPEEVLNALCRCLSDDFDIEHSTFQIESRDRQATETMAH
jgi:cobalt-zinc-cadmium efflux system protein